MLGGELSKVAALAIKAAAIWPFRCAWRPASSAKASNTPKVEGPNFKCEPGGGAGLGVGERQCAGQEVGKRSLLPGLASRRTNRASLVMLYSFG